MPDGRHAELPWSARARSSLLPCGAVRSMCSSPEESGWSSCVRARVAGWAGAVTGRRLGKEEADFGAIRNFGQQLVDVPMQRGMLPEGIQFTQRHENEPALMEAGMRNSEIRLIDNTTAIKENVEIDCPRTRAVLLV